MALAKRRGAARVITTLRIRGLGVIESTEVELGPGLTVITGETGAGKTMVVTSLGLLRGGRADSAAVRAGRTRADVDAEISLDAASPVSGLVAEAGGEVDDGVLLVSRSVGADGRTRAFIGGRAVPNAVLADLGDELISIHGQSEQLLLRSPERRRAALDRYAGNAELQAAWSAAYEELRAAAAALEVATSSDADKASRIAAWRTGLAEIDQVAPRAGEEDTLAAEIERLSNAESLREAATSAHDLLRADEGEDAIGQLGTARRLLGASGDPQLAALADRVAAIAAQLGDVADEISGVLGDLDGDPRRLDALQLRLSTLRSLRRRYAAAGTIDDVIAWADRARASLAAEDDSSDAIEKLRAREATARSAAATAGAELSRSRTAAAERFAEQVSAELGALAMAHARLDVVVDQRPDADGLDLADGRRVAVTAHGIDEVDFLLTPHRGAPARPIAKGASGGELSRVMLAIEVVFAGADPVPTFVFDEVDAGVGGSAATEVGRRLARLGRSAQVLVVTHLAQVAAFADAHLVVAKTDDGSVVSSGVARLDEAQRIRELARMLGGVADSAKAAAHAAELIELATLARAGKAKAAPRRTRGMS